MAQPIDSDTREPAAWLDGTDPAGWADTAAAAGPFPPPLDVDVPAPDGGWVDPDLLGATAAAGNDAAEVAATDPPEALRADLAAADGDPGADWATLRESADPAVRALALRWQP